MSDIQVDEVDEIAEIHQEIVNFFSNNLTKEPLVDYSQVDKISFQSLPEEDITTFTSPFLSRAQFSCNIFVIDLKIVS